jgi:hypothetical protein
VGLLLLMAFSVVACGATSNAKQAALEATLSVQLQSDGLSSALTQCITQHAAKLPVGELQEVMGSGSGSSVNRSLIVRRFGSCFSGPAGVAQARADFSKLLPATTAPSLRRCDEAGIAALPADQLASFMSKVVAAGGAITAAHDERLEADLNAMGDRCLELPAARPLLIRNLLKGLSESSSASSWSAAFKTCFAKQWRAGLEQLASSELVRLVTQPGASATPAKAAGKAAARSCEASGITP